MSDESRPFRGPFTAEADPNCEHGYWRITQGNGEPIISLCEQSGAEQLRLALELLELLPEIEEALRKGSYDEPSCFQLRERIAALKEPRT